MVVDTFSRSRCSTQVASRTSRSGWSRYSLVPTVALDWANRRPSATAPSSRTPAPTSQISPLTGSSIGEPVPIAAASGDPTGRILAPVTDAGTDASTDASYDEATAGMARTTGPSTRSRY